jgi:hypothetical protein
MPANCLKHPSFSSPAPKSNKCCSTESATCAELVCCRELAGTAEFLFTLMGALNIIDYMANPETKLCQPLREATDVNGIYPADEIHESIFDFLRPRLFRVNGFCPTQPLAN